MEIDDEGDNNQASEVRIVCGPCGLAHHSDESCQVRYLPYCLIPRFNPNHPSSRKAMAIESKNRPDKKRKGDNGSGIFTDRIFCMLSCSFAFCFF